MLRRVGHEILTYLKEVFSSPGSQIKICVDPYAFKNCVERAGCSYDAVISQLKNSARCQSDDGYRALAIVAFQTKITYEISLNSIFNDAYLPMLNRYGISDTNGYFSGGTTTIGKTAQDKTWQIASDILEKNDLFLDLGNVYEHDGAYRYVQYPRSQRIISKNDLLKFIDVFESLGLLPGSDISYNDFKRLLEKRPVCAGIIYNAHIECHTGKASDFLGRLVYGFYKNWDGSSRPDFERFGGGGGGKHVSENYFFSAYPFDEGRNFEINGSLKKGQKELQNVPEVVIAGSQCEKNPYFTLVFGYSSEWCFAKGYPRLGQSVLMIYKQTDWKRIWALRTDNPDEIFIRPWKDYYVVAVKSLTDKIANILRLKYRSEPPVEYIGGLRSRYAYVQGWLDFAKPMIRLSSVYSNEPIIIKNKKNSFSREVKINNSIIDLETVELAPDQYFIISNGRRVPDSDFEIASITKEMRKESICGWELTTIGELSPCKDCSRINVVGFDFSCEDGAESNERFFLRKMHKFGVKKVQSKNYLRHSNKLV